MGGRPRCAVGSRQRREEGAARFHHRRRFRHHAEVPRLPAAAHRRRGLPAVQEWVAGVREDQGCGGEEEAQYRVQTLTVADLRNSQTERCASTKSAPFSFSHTPMFIRLFATWLTCVALLIAI